MIYSDDHGKTWKLAGDAGGAVLEGVDAQPVHGARGATRRRT